MISKHRGFFFSFNPTHSRGRWELNLKHAGLLHLTWSVNVHACLCLLGLRGGVTAAGDIFREGTVLIQAMPELLRTETKNRDISECI